MLGKNFSYLLRALLRLSHEELLAFRNILKWKSLPILASQPFHKSIRNNPIRKGYIKTVGIGRKS